MPARLYEELYNPKNCGKHIRKFMFAGVPGVFTYYCYLQPSPLSIKNGEGIAAKCRTFPEIMKNWGRCRGKTTDLPQKRLITGKVAESISKTSEGRRKETNSSFGNQNKYQFPNRSLRKQSYPDRCDSLRKRRSYHKGQDPNILYSFCCNISGTLSI